MPSKPLKIAEIILLIVVLGVVGWWLMKKPVGVAQTSPTPTAIADTTGWKTYRNDRCGFELKYSSDLSNVVTDNCPDGDSDVILINEDGDVYLTLHARPTGEMINYSLERFVESIKKAREIGSKNKPAGVKYVIIESNFDDRPALILEPQEASAVANVGREIFVENNGFLYTIFCNYPTLFVDGNVAKYVDEKRKTIDQIVSTFKFTK